MWHAEALIYQINPAFQLQNLGCQASKTIMGGGGGNSGGETWETGILVKPRIEGVFLPLSKRYGKRPYRLWSESFILLITRKNYRVFSLKVHFFIHRPDDIIFDKFTI